MRGLNVEVTGYLPIISSCKPLLNVNRIEASKCDVTRSFGSNAPHHVIGKE